LPGFPTSNYTRARVRNRTDAEPDTATSHGAGLRIPRWPKGDAVPIAILVLLPVLVFGVPALLGHSVVPGDDLLQNYPLRVLAGRQIAAGHLPVYDPYIWSGAPLLADWNAGAVYPLTLLFAILPGAAAWALNLIATYAVAGVSMFWFLRAQRLGSLASFLGALTFAFAGAMPAQVGHFGLVAGVSWIPVELLAIFRLTEQPGRASRLRWVCVLAVAFGLTVLAGEPRAIDDAALVLFIYAAWRVGRLGCLGHRARRLPRCRSAAAGAFRCQHLPARGKLVCPVHVGLAASEMAAHGVRARCAGRLGLLRPAGILRQLQPC
jgi:hypothetical protein